MAVVEYEVKSKVATLTLSRPERLNAWTQEMEDQFLARLEDAAEDSSVHAIIVTGAGRGFCAGADMDVLQADEGPVDGSYKGSLPLLTPLRVPKPIIAAINGPCAGVGLQIAMTCDVRFAAAGTKFTTAFARRGLVAEHGISWLLPRLAGLSVSLDLLLSARTFFAEEAKELGLVNYVVPEGKALSEAVMYARELADYVSPAAMADIKRQLYSHVDTDLVPSVLESDRLMYASFARQDFDEGVSSFVQRRPPRFAGLSAAVEPFKEEHRKPDGSRG